MFMIAIFLKNYIFRKKIHVSFEKENLNLTKYQANCFQKKNKSEIQKKKGCATKIKRRR